MKKTKILLMAIMILAVTTAVSLQARGQTWIPYVGFSKKVTSGSIPVCISGIKKNPTDDTVFFGNFDYTEVYSSASKIVISGLKSSIKNGSQGWVSAGEIYEGYDRIYTYAETPQGTYCGTAGPPYVEVLNQNTNLFEQTGAVLEASVSGIYDWGGDNLLLIGGVYSGAALLDTKSNVVTDLFWGEQNAQGIGYFSSYVEKDSSLLSSAYYFPDNTLRIVSLKYGSNKWEFNGYPIVPAGGKLVGICAPSVDSVFIITAQVIDDQRVDVLYQLDNMTWKKVGQFIQNDPWDAAPINSFFCYKGKIYIFGGIEGTYLLYDGKTILSQEGTLPLVLRLYPGYAQMLFHIDSTFFMTSNADQYGNPFGVQTVYKSNEDLLPVTLISFTAVVKNESVLLSWRTSEEINTKSFSIERSYNGKNFSVIGTITAKGNQSSYLYSDNFPLEGMNYYRLRIIDNDGKISYSNTVVVTNNNSVHLIVAPNPASNELAVYGYNGVIKIVSLDGRVVYTGTVTYGMKISLQGLANGVYFLVSDKKIIKFLKQ